MKSMLDKVSEVFLFLSLFVFCTRELYAGIACSRSGVVASACPIATSVGVDVLERGGNAIDAAIAVGFALAVTYPQAGNIGGGGFMLIRESSGKCVFLDFREKAPFAAHRDMYLDDAGNVIAGQSLYGAKACAVPGTVRGLERAHALYGSLPWKELVEPSIELARDGFTVSRDLAGSLKTLEPFIDRFPALVQFRKEDRTALESGDTLRQPDLAKTLELIASEGADAFYRGPIADLIVSEMKLDGGIITRRDLESYEVVEREPVIGSYRGYDIISAPPPSSGGTIIIEILNMLEKFDLRDATFLSERHIHLMAEAERRAYLDRAKYLGDPDFVDNPIALLTSKSYAARLAGTIKRRASRSSSIEPMQERFAKEGMQTTHYSIVDKFGNVVALTTTLNDSYGSRILVRGAGFLLNNEMDDFSLKPNSPNLYGLVGGSANEIAPGKRMLSSMSPTIVMRGTSPWLVLGTPGGATIITTVVQIVVNMVDFGMSLEEAISAPRFHHQWLPDAISFESGAFSRKLIGRLKDRGHRLEERSSLIGNVQAIEILEDCACAVSDPRGWGAAVAPLAIAPQK